MCANEVSGIQYTTIQVKTEGGIKEVRMPQRQIEINLANNNMRLNSDGTYTLGKSDAPKPESTTTITTSIAGTDFFKDNKVDPQLSDALKDIATIDNEGNVTLKAGVTKEQFLNAMKQYSIQNSITEPQLELSGDYEWKQHLVDEGAVAETQDNKGYTIKDRERLNNLTTAGEPQQSIKQTKKMEFQFAETTVTAADEIVPPPGLEGDKKLQTQLETEYKSKLYDWKDDPANAELKEQAIANMRYGKKVDKLAAKMQNTPHAKLTEDYINKYFTPEERDRIFEHINRQVMDSNIDGERFAELYNGVRLKNEAEMSASDFSLTDANGNPKTGAALADAQRNRKAALLNAQGVTDRRLSPENLLRNYVVKEVLSQRSDEEKVDDEIYFVNEQAKRNVRADISDQRQKNTKLFWNKAAKKAYIADAEKSGRDISNERLEVISRGDRKMAQRTGVFGREVTPNGNNLKEGVDYDFTREYKDPITGQKRTAYYKFSSDDYQEYFKKSTDSRFDTDKLAEDNHLTLNEANQAGVEGNMALDENYKRQTYEGIRGFKKNDEMGYWERKHYRASTRRAGFDTDKDRTQIKRFGYAMGEGAKAAVLSFATAGAGSIIAGALTVAPEAIQWTSNGKYVDYKTEGFKKLVEGQEYSGEVTHQTVVNGKVYKNTTPYEGKTPDRWIEVEGQQGKVWVDPETGEVYSKGGTDNTYFKTALNASLIGGGMAFLGALVTSQGVQDKGTYWDGRINLNKKPQTTTTNTAGAFEYEQTIPVEERIGTYSTETQKFKNKPLQGPAAYSVMFHYEDGSSVDPMEFAHAYQKKIGGPMSKNYFYIFNDLTDSKGRKIIPYEGNDLQNKYNNIPNGTRRANTSEVSPQNVGRIYQGKARITG